MKLVYPMLWSRLARVMQIGSRPSTPPLRSRGAGTTVTMLLPRLAGDPPLDSDALRALFRCQRRFPHACSFRCGGPGRPAIPSLLVAAQGAAQSRGESGRCALFAYPGDARGRRRKPGALRHRSLPALARRSAGPAPADPPHRRQARIASASCSIRTSPPKAIAACGVAEEKLLVAHNGADLAAVRARAAAGT